MSVLGKAAQCLCAESLPPEQVHRARRLLKTANALALLLSASVGQSGLRMVRELRAIRRQLGTVRDLDVLVATLEGFGPDVDPGLLAVLHTELEAQINGRVGREERVREGPDLRRELLKLSDAASFWRLDSARSDALIEALKQSYRRARRRGEKALVSRSDVDLHQMRKAAIIHREQLASISDVWPRQIRAWGDEAQNLRDALGALNDLAMLREFLATRETAADGVDDLIGLINKDRERALEKARPSFARLFCERPRDWSRRIEAWLANPKKRPEIMVERVQEVA